MIKHKVFTAILLSDFPLVTNFGAVQVTFIAKERNALKGRCIEFRR